MAMPHLHGTKAALMLSLCALSQTDKPTSILPRSPHKIGTSTSLKLNSALTQNAFITLERAQTQHSHIINRLKTRSLRNPNRNNKMTLHIILIGVGGTIYNDYTITPLINLGMPRRRYSLKHRLGQLRGFLLKRAPGDLRGAAGKAEDGSTNPPAPGADEHAREAVGAAELIDAVLAREPIPVHLFLPLSNEDASHKSAAARAACGASPMGISLEWRNLSYCVPTPEGPKALLRGVWGSVCGGEMMALVGASGAGKSTLMELLTLRKAPSAITPPSHTTTIMDQGGSIQESIRLQEQGGTSNLEEDLPTSDGTDASDHCIQRGNDGPDRTVPRGSCALGIVGSADGRPGVTPAAGGKERGMLLLNGAVARASRMRRVCSYIPQVKALIMPPEISRTALIRNEHDDSLLPQMTVAEVLRLHAALTLPTGLPRQEVQSRQHNVLMAMGLWHARDTLVLLLAQGRMVYQGSSRGTTMVDWFTQQVPRAIAQHTPKHRPHGTQHGEQQRATAAASQAQGPDNPLASPQAGLALRLCYDPECHGTPVDWVMDLLNSPSLVSEHLLSRGLVAFSPPVQVTPHDQGMASNPECCDASMGYGSGPDFGTKGGLGEGRGWVEVAADAFGAHFLRVQQQQEQQEQQQEQQGQQQQQQQGSALQADELPAGLHGSQMDALQSEAEQEQQQQQQQPRQRELGGHLLSSVPGRLRDLAIQQLQHLQGWGQQYRALVWREGLAVTRNPSDVAGR
ncbi:hypothetical protein DUNSADRAFT_14471 [Dunaliella salina]|uniref:ABC transporter domain-containing protein n=1 Tax=Dunaliella salina TaxID=3046 RepID=A0ABQ7H2I8_DUNSA|nr:hypothetical protein DUNSADRAFT_14471 [Dunaliella salina]|eukprot:KAF5841072.1 hypothetical protein DUNSADRAFT_14471 [Dunaliella salina]